MNQEKNPFSRRRILLIAAMLLIFVVLPVGSLLYLRGGYKWRKQAVSELRDHGKVRSVPIIWQDGTKEDQIKGKVCVLYYFGDNPDLTATNREVLDTGEELYKQFGQNPNFRLVMIAANGTAEFRSHAQKLPSYDYATWVWSSALGSWKTILANGYESFCLAEDVRPADAYYALSDTSGTIRRFYTATDKKQVTRMREHIAILLPVE